MNSALLIAVCEARRRLAEVGPAFVRSVGDFERVSLPNDDCDVLRDLLIEDRARTVLEIGLAYGASALAIEEALLSHDAPGTTHVIVDAFQHHFRHAGWDAIVSTGAAGRCTLLEERSHLALPQLLADGVVVDAAFVDGSHAFHNVFVDLRFCWELVHPGGLIVLDDCEWPSVAIAVHYYEVNAGWLPQPIERPTRLRAFRLPDPRVDPPFETFRPFGTDHAP